MRAYIISIGAELLHGHITDTNATFLAQELDAHGIELLHVTQVGDDRDRIRSTIERALHESDFVICTGGIGPTEDDLTREAIADVAGETPQVSPELRAEIEAFFAARGLPMPERNAKQAWLIPSVEPLPNPIGTAPGWFANLNKKTIVAMPGVPREMKRMWLEQVAPRLGKLLSGRAYSTTTLKTIGIGESALEQEISDLVALTNPIVATYAKDDGVHIRVVGIGDDLPSARAVRDEAADRLVARVRPFIYGTDEESLAGSLARRLIERSLQLNVVDHGGGGQFAALMLGDEAGSQVVGCTESRSGTTTPATELARQARGQDNNHIGLGISLSASPSGAVYEGIIAVAIAGPLEASQDFPMKSSLQELQRRSALFAAGVLHEVLT